MPKRKQIKHQGGAPKSYLHRLPRAIKTLEAMDEVRTVETLVDREWISEHLGVSKATALRILAAAGADFEPTIHGNVLLIEVKRLRSYFQVLAGYSEPEIRRQTRTAKQLTQMARYMSQHQAVIAGKRDGSRLAKSTFKDLEKNGIWFGPVSMTLQFTSFQDFLKKFGMVVYALQNDFDEMQQYLDTTSRDRS